MAVNEYIIEQILDNYNRDARVIPFLVEVTSPLFSFDVNNDIVILSNDKLDVPITSTVKINSNENVLITSKTEFENWSEQRNQQFSNTITVETKNYGLLFVPYQLSFMRIQPTPNSTKQLKNNGNTNKQIKFTIRIIYIASSPV